jgi:hypothetical protein
MNLADVAPQPEYAFGGLAVALLSTLLAVAAIVLVVVLVRRNRKGSGGA